MENLHQSWYIFFLDGLFPLAARLQEFLYVGDIACFCFKTLQNKKKTALYLRMMVTVRHLDATHAVKVTSQVDPADYSKGL